MQGSISGLIYYKILSLINIDEICHYNRNVLLIYCVKSLAHLLFSKLGIFQSTGYSAADLAE